MPGDLDRRTFLRRGALALGGLTLVRTPLARAVDAASRRALAAEGVGGDGKLRVYTIVVDGLSPGEVEMMPRLSGLAGEGTVFAGSEAVMVAETIPNHVAMLTGVRGERNGVPANEIYDRAAGEVRTAGRPDDVTAPTVFDPLRKAGLPTASVVSKEYLYTVLDGQADHHWEPAPQIPESDHAPDPFTMEALLGTLADHDPAFTFVNLGDVDRSGHADPTGNLALPAFRTAAMLDTDNELGGFFDFLADQGWWESSVVVVVSDHSMDWSPPHGFVDIGEALDAEPSVAGKYALALNGGANLVYWTGPAGERDGGLARMRQVITAVEGVATAESTSAHDLGPKAGDLVVFADDGYRFAETTDPTSNPIPGNHGHPPTLPNVFLVGGGAGILRRGEVVEPAGATNLDVGPTVAWLFDRLGVVPGAASFNTGLEGVVRSEAFTLGDRKAGGGGGDARRKPPAAADGGGAGTEVLGATAGEGGGATGASEPLPATGGGTVAAGASVVGAAALARLAARAGQPAATPNAPAE